MHDGCRVAEAFENRYDAKHDPFITTSQDGEEEVWAAASI